MLRCSPEAFAQCPTHHLCGRWEDATFTEDSECDRFNQQVTARPMTNREKLFAMSDEEFAEFFLCLEQGNLTIEVCGPPYCDPDHCPHDCGPAIVKWLNSPAEV